MVRPQDKYLSINGLKLHYLDWGSASKQAMLLLHGFIALANAWDYFAPAFSHRYHVLALDQRGHGESQWPSNAAYTTEDHLVDIACFVDALNLDNFVMVGHSMGGRNAIMYSGCFPDKVAQLILIDCRPVSDLESSGAIGELLSIIPDETSSIDEVALELKCLYPRLSLEMACYLASHCFMQMPNGKFSPKCDLTMKEQAKRAGYRVSDLWPFLEYITCPTLIIRGAESPVLPREIAQRMCQANHNARLVEIEGATHLPPQENPTAFEEVVKCFLEN